MKIPIVLYDGNCPFCCSIINYLQKKEVKINYLSITEKSAKLILKRYKIKEIKSVLYIENNRIYSKSNAILKICSKAKFPLKLFLALYIFPTPILDYFYGFISKRRMKISSKKCCNV